MIKINKIRRVRKSLRLNTAGLAHKLGVSTRTIEGYESGNNVPKTVWLLLERIVQDNEDRLARLKAAGKPEI